MEQQGNLLRAPAAHPSGADFWPSDSLPAWRDAPEHAFVSWLAQLRILGDRHFRESSKDTYFAMFATWMRFLADRKMTVLEATAREASDFFADKALVPVSRRRYLQLLDKVYLHLISLNWQHEHPLKTLLRDERELAIPAPIGLDDPELQTLTTAVGNLEGSKSDRDRALFALMVGAGLRSNEVINLDRVDLHTDFRITVRSHTVHQAHEALVLPDGPWRGWLEAWKLITRKRLIPGKLFCPATALGKGYTPSGLFRRINHWFDLAKITPTQGGANVLRNTYARLALNSGRYTIEQVQGFMGHEELRATQRHMAVIVPTHAGELDEHALNKILDEHEIKNWPSQVDVFSGSGSMR